MNNRHIEINIEDYNDESIKDLTPIIALYEVGTTKDNQIQLDIFLDNI